MRRGNSLFWGLALCQSESKDCGSVVVYIYFFGYEMVVANEARSAELAIIISYPTSASGTIVLLKRPKNSR